MSSFEHFLQSLRTGGPRHQTHQGLNVSEGAPLETQGEGIDLVDCLTTLGYEVQSAPRREM